jgi:hypothetical protein
VVRNTDAQAEQGGERAQQALGLPPGAAKGQASGPAAHRGRDGRAGRDRRRPTCSRPTWTGCCCCPSCAGRGPTPCCWSWTTSPPTRPPPGPRAARRLGLPLPPPARLPAGPLGSGAPKPIESIWAKVKAELRGVAARTGRAPGGARPRPRRHHPAGRGRVLPPLRPWLAQLLLRRLN